MGHTGERTYPPCHGGRDRMQAYFLEHMYHIPREVTVLLLRLCPTCQAGKGRKSTLKMIHKPILPAGVGVRGQADLVDLQLCPDNGYKFILNYQDCFSKFVVLRPLKSKTADEVAQCLVHIFCEHGPPHILHTDNGTEFSNRTLIAILHRLWSSTRIVHGRPRHPEDQGSVERGAWSVLMATSRSYSTPGSRMRTKNRTSGCRIFLITVVLMPLLTLCILGERRPISVWTCHYPGK